MYVYIYMVFKIKTFRHVVFFKILLYAIIHIRNFYHKSYFTIKNN